jgi:hypothetical protein
MKKCSKCKLEKLRTEFALRSKSKDGLKPTCKVCSSSSYHKEYWKEFPERRKTIKENLKKHKQLVAEKIVEHFIKNPRVECGETNILKLEFDHLNDKEFNISEGITMGFAWKRMEKEINKCQVLCANCHAVKSAYQNNNWRIKFI